MQRAFISTVVILGTLLSLSFGQQVLPPTTVRTLQGEELNTADLTNGENPLIISFWATWCKPCLAELNAIMEDYEDWVDETGVKLIAISIDDARTSYKVPSMVSGYGWEYDVYLDENSDFKRAMNVVNVPWTILLNSQGEIIYQRPTYAPGDEEHLYEKVLEMSSSD